MVVFIPNKLVYSILVSVAIIVVPNFIFSAASFWFSLGRPWINLDYLFFSILFASGFRIWACLLLLISVVVDALNIIGQVYPFVRVGDLLYLSKFVLVSSVESQLYLALAVAFLLLSVFLLLKLSWKVSLAKSLVLFNLAIGFYLVDVYTGGGERDKYWRVTERPIVSSQIVSFYDYRSRGFIEEFTIQGEPFIDVGFHGATATWDKNLRDLPDKILLIVNESWGVLASPEANAAILAPIVNSNGRYEVQAIGDLRFSGATVAAELRELCGLRPNHFNLAPVVHGFENCLPERLRQLGYSTHAFHGAVGIMYDRHLWYPRVGFQKMTFYESNDWPNRCYSFPGACDRDVVSKVKGSLKGGYKNFVYWLTLNTHNFYDPRDIAVDVFNCERYGIDKETETCRNAKLQAQFFFVISQALDDPELVGLDVVVVGDHSPPIFNLSEKEDYFRDGFVSVLKFKVK